MANAVAAKESTYAFTNVDCVTAYGCAGLPFFDSCLGWKLSGL